METLIEEMEYSYTSCGLTPPAYIRRAVLQLILKRRDPAFYKVLRTAVNFGLEG